jgi:hypothetical protein
MTGKGYSGPLGLPARAMIGDLGALLAFPKSGSPELARFEEELWEQFGDLTRREQEAEVIAAQGYPFIG